MSNHFVWRYDAKGRAYCVDEGGRHVIVRPEDFKHQVPSVGGSTRPEIRDNHFRTSGDRANTYPPCSQPSYAHQCLAQGRNRPHYGPGSQHSGRPDVDHPAAHRDVEGVSRPKASTDVYRDSKADWGREGPTTSAYNEEYYAYKAQVIVDVRQGQEFEAHMKTKPKLSQQEIRDNRDKLGGDPIATREWHEEAARKATEAAEAAAAHASGRREYDQDYIAYHQHRYHRGHKQAIDNAENRRNNFLDEAAKHNAWESVGSHSPPVAEYKYLHRYLASRWDKT